MTDPIQPRPQPVVDVAGTLGGLAKGAFTAVFILVNTIAVDGITPGNIGTVGNLIGLAVAAVGGLVVFLVSLFHARKAAKLVTPLSDPRNDRGEPLVDPDTYGRHAAKAIEPEDRWAPGWYDRGGVLPPAVTVTYNATGKPIPVVTRTDTQEIPRVTDEPVRRIPEHVVPGKRLGRHVRHDPRSLRFLVPETSTPTTAMWQRRVPVFDQGNLGSCTGNAAAGVLGTDPFYGTLPAGLVDDENEAVSLYSAATKLDDYDGSYPPDDTGSDGLSVAKACKQAGLISGYTHITSVAAAQTAIKSGPFIVGVNWYSSMDNPNADGLVKVSGQIRGGHEFECHGYDAEADLWWFTNSWGTGWGKDGTFCMSSASFARLLSEQGDATVFLPIAAPFPPQPTPTPTPTPPAPAPSLPPSSVRDWAVRTQHLKDAPQYAEHGAADYLAWLAQQ